MAKTRAQKELNLQELIEKLGKARAVVFADYKGMTMPQLSELRSKLREISSEFSVTKNTLMNRALKESGKALDQELEGPTATLFAYDDEITPIKALVKAIKDNNIGQVKAGFLGDQALNNTKVNQLATLPGKDELRGQVVGVLAAPLKGMLTVLNGNLRNLVVVLNEIQKTKGGEK